MTTLIRSLQIARVGARSAQLPRSVVAHAIAQARARAKD